MNDPVPYIPIIGTTLGLLSLWRAMICNHRRRLLQDTPTSKTNGVFIGFVELKGSAESETPFTSYLAEARCVYYSWDISEHWSRTVIEHYTDNEGRSQTRTRHESGWTSVAVGGQSAPFYLKDDTGIILVHPDGATLELATIYSESCNRSSPLYYGKGPTGSVADSDHRRQFTETAIPLHQPVYVCGQSRLREDIVAPEIAKHRDAPLFVISTRDEEEICNSYAWSIYGWWLFGLILFAGGWGLAAGMAAANSGTELWIFPALISGLAYAGFTGLAWVWMVFDSLVRLRQRVAQGWSLIDVQLNRRHDLIPALVAAVKGFSNHETEVQAIIAEMRAQYTLADSGQPGEGLQSFGARLVALAESYPDLKADAAFMKLQEEIIGTENRVALARGYFNEIATYYNTRIAVVPEKLVAGMVGMKPHPVMVANDFERAPVAVNLSE